MFANKKIVYTGGTWDIFHMGHLNLIQRAKTYGDILIVGVTPDDIVLSYKKKIPIISYEERFRIIESLSCVDFVVRQDVLIGASLMKCLNVDIVVIGNDWKDKYLPGLDWARKNLKVIYLPRTPDISSSVIKQRME